MRCGAWDMPHIEENFFILQKRALRIICNKPRREHTDPLFKELHILKLHDINSYLITNLMFKFYHNDVPNILHDMFTYNNAVYSHNTQHNCELHLAIIRCNLECSVI